ncbi:MAG TPA: polysaccharide deacetylase family protein [Terracidiphilus sp.]
MGTGLSLISGAAVVAASAGLAIGGYAYASLWPTSQIFGPTLTAPRKPGEIALTFDDGPNPAWTPRLLELLDKHGVKATFFLIGKYASEQSTLTRLIANNGHLIGNHTWSHPNLARTAPRKVREELRTTNDTLERITGKPIRYFRPPFGARRPDVLHIADALGLTPVTWNAMTSDWSQPSADRIAATLSTKVDRLHARGSAANIVLHDGSHREPAANREPSVTATGQLLDRYAKTHRFVTVAEWD